MLDGKSGGKVRPGECGDDIGNEPFRYDLLNPASIDRVFSSYECGGACGGTAGARCSLR